MNTPEDVKPPAFGEEVEAARPSAETIALLTRRRSTAADFLAEPGPDRDTLARMLELAARAPDHRRVTPFRFVVFEGGARAAAGDALAEAFAAANPDADPARVEVERRRFNRAPVVVGVVARIDPAHRTPVWEQTLTVGAVCQNLLIAASAHGFAAQWLTEWYAFDEGVSAAFGLAPEEQIAGYVYLGSASAPPKERARPDMAAITSFYAGD